MTSRQRIAVIGLDCAPPCIVFDRLRDELPNVSRLMNTGTYGVLRSCDPPITVPAWAVMTSGYDAGQLGVYGFRNRRDHSYSAYSVATSAAIRKPRLWDHFSKADRDVITIGVPQTFPVRAVKGIQISGFLAPNTKLPYTHPAGLRDEIQEAVGDYIIDATDYRTPDKTPLLETIRTMTSRRFDLACHLVMTKPWDLFFMVEIGTDRLHHGFWHFYDPGHPSYAGPDNPFVDAIPEYYRLLDSKIGELLEALGPETHVMVVSDHGARPMIGGVCINEWLVREGYLVLEEYPGEPTPTPRLKIDWKRTRAWSEGGYYARVFINVSGREPDGPVMPNQYDTLCDELSARIAAITGFDDEDLGTRVVRPGHIYKETNGVPPDLMVYFGNMGWRSIGSVGNPDGQSNARILSRENDTGPDSANHDWEGIYISSLPMKGHAAGQQGAEHRLIDVGPSLLALVGLEIPADCAGGAAMCWAEAACTGSE